MQNQQQVVRPVFTDEELIAFLDARLYPAYHFEGVPSREFVLAQAIRDAVEAKVLGEVKADAL
jgi:hypothetical protein